MQEQEQNESSRPASVQAEVTVLGAMMIDQNAVNDAIELLTADDFSLDSHRRIFRCIGELAETGNTVDYVTVTEDLRRRKEMDAVGGIGYVTDLSSGVPRNFNVVAYCKIIKEKSVLRGLISLCEVATARASDQSEPSSAILEDAEERILELAQVTAAQQFTTILDSAKEVGGVDAFVDRMCDPAQMTGLPTGFTEVDKILGGLKKKELIIVAARPSQGKSALALCIAANVVMADPQAVVALFSLEMGKEALYKRLLASQAYVSVRKAHEGWLGRDERAKLQSAFLRIGDRHLMIDDSSSMTTTQMRAKCRRLKQQMGRLDLIQVDYLQLMHGTKRYGNRQEEVASVSRGLKAMAKELDVPVVALAQVGRGSEQRTGDKRPMLSDLRESGQIEADADCVAFIHRAEYYASEDDPDVERGTAEIIVAKNRDGATGIRKLAYLADITKFENLEVRR
jgi:replicative DNA helicase